MRRNSYGIIIDQEGYAPSIFPEAEHTCFYADDRYSACGDGEIQRHVVFYDKKDAGLSEISKAHGAWVNLCPVHIGLVKMFPQMKRALEREAQQRMMEKHGWDEEEFLRIFGKDYLVREDESSGQEGDAFFEY